MEYGTLTEDKDRILEEIFVFYSTLFRSNPEVATHVGEKEQALSLITKKITDEENRTMIEEPMDDEIEKLVMALPTEKSPRIDGVTTKVLTKFWPVMKEACTTMIKVLWRDGTLTLKASTGVIKLIPKNHAVLLLFNWRPLTMLTLTDKLCAKLVATGSRSLQAKL